MSLIDDVTGWSPAVFASRSRDAGIVMHTEHGHAVEIDASRWHDPADAVDLGVLARLAPPVLDIGSGPGRMLVALAALGVPAAGIDICPHAVAEASARGGAAVLADVFGDVPSAGGWEGALLLDGNVGIGGDPVRLLRRVAELLTPNGRLVVEAAAPTDTASGQRVRLTHRDGSTGWFPWAVVSVTDLPDHAQAAGWRVDETWLDGRRWFVCLVRTSGGPT